MSMQRCVCCGDPYEPEPSAVIVKDGVRRVLQKTCGKKRCEKRRKAMAQARWLAKNPGAYRGLYIKTQLWLVEHPGYLQAYRAKNPAAARCSGLSRGSGTGRTRVAESDIADLQQDGDRRSAVTQRDDPRSSRWLQEPRKNRQ